MNGHSAQRVVELFRSAAAASSPQPRIALGYPKERAAQAPVSWAEGYAGRIRSARQHLERQGVAVTRVVGSDVIPRWIVTGSKASIGNEELLQLAADRGWA